MTRSRRDAIEGAIFFLTILALVGLTIGGIL